MRDDSANGAQADDEAGFLLHLKGFLGVPDLPAALPLLHVALHQVLGQRQHQRHGVLGHATVVGPRRDDHRDAQGRGGGHVHAVIPDARTADDLQGRTGLHGLLVDGPLVGHPDDEGVGVLELVQVVVGMGVVGHENLGLVLQQGHTLPADGLRHSHFHWLVLPFPCGPGLISPLWRWPSGCRSPWR